MSDVATLELALAEIRKRDGKYNERAYIFVLAALEFAQTRLPARRHLSGVELAWACRDFALAQFGMLAAAVLTHWGVRTTEDFGVSRTSRASTTSLKSSGPARGIGFQESLRRASGPCSGSQRPLLPERSH